MTSRHPFQLPTALGAALVLALAGCAVEPDAGATGDPGQLADDPGQPADDPSQTSADDGEARSGGFPVTIPTAGGELVIEQRPERIVSLSPSATELLFAIGAGDQVVAADEFSTYPAEAPTTDLSGFDPNVEAVVGHEPDLVVVATDTNDLVASLEELDIPVLVNAAPTDVESGYEGIADLGLATGHVEETAAVAARMRAELEEAFAAAPQGADLRVYHEVDPTFFAASSHSFIGSVYAQMGAVNIADEADTDRNGYPQLTEEAIVEANPQLIVITDLAGVTAEEVAARPGWAEVDAVRSGAIVTVSSDIASRWGPRLPQLVEDVAAAMSQVAVPAGR